MNAEIWAAVGTTIAMLVLFIVPGLVYTWYALESMIGDRESYSSVIAQSNDVPVRNGRERGRPGGDRNDDEDRSDGYACSFAQLSLSPSVRLKTSRRAVDSRSGQK